MEKRSTKRDRLKVTPPNFTPRPEEFDKLFAAAAAMDRTLELFDVATSEPIISRIPELACIDRAVTRLEYLISGLPNVFRRGYLAITYPKTKRKKGIAFDDIFRGTKANNEILYLDACIPVFVEGSIKECERDEGREISTFGCRTKVNDRFEMCWAITIDGLNALIGLTNNASVSKRTVAKRVTKLDSIIIEVVQEEELLRKQVPDENSVIHLIEVTEARAEVDKRHAAVVAQVQALLDSLAGRRGSSPEENKRIAEEVYDTARCSGIQLLYNDQPAYFYWASGVFQMRSTDSSRTPLGPASAAFPELRADVRQAGKESGDSVSKEGGGFAGKIKGGPKRKR